MPDVSGIRNRMFDDASPHGRNGASRTSEGKVVVVRGDNLHKIAARCYGLTDPHEIAVAAELIYKANIDKMEEKGRGYVREGWELTLPPKKEVLQTLRYPVAGRNPIVDASVHFRNENIDYQFPMEYNKLPFGDDFLVPNAPLPPLPNKTPLNGRNWMLSAAPSILDRISVRPVKPDHIDEEISPRQSFDHYAEKNDQVQSPWEDPDPYLITREKYIEKRAEEPVAIKEVYIYNYDYENRREETRTEKIGSERAGIEFDNMDSNHDGIINRQEWEDYAAAEIAREAPPPLSLQYVQDNHYMMTPDDGLSPSISRLDVSPPNVRNWMSSTDPSISDGPRPVKVKDPPPPQLPFNPPSQPASMDDQPQPVRAVGDGITDYPVPDDQPPPPPIDDVPPLNVRNVVDDIIDFFKGYWMAS